MIRMIFKGGQVLGLGTGLWLRSEEENIPDMRMDDLERCEVIPNEVKMLKGQRPPLEPGGKPQEVRALRIMSESLARGEGFLDIVLPAEDARIIGEALIKGSFPQVETFQSLPRDLPAAK